MVDLQLHVRLYYNTSIYYNTSGHEVEDLPKEFKSFVRKIRTRRYIIISVIIILFLLIGATIEGLVNKYGITRRILLGEDENIKNFFYNNTYDIDGGTYSFIKGKYHDEGLIGSYAEIDTIIKTNFSGLKNEYTLFISGAWGGGNSIWGYVLVLNIESRKIHNIFICSSVGMPMITRDYILTFGYDWNSGPHCCPTIQFTYKYSWDGTKFILVSKETNRI